MLRKRYLAEDMIKAVSMVKLERHFIEITNDLSKMRDLSRELEEAKRALSKLDGAIKKGDKDIEEHYVEELHDILRTLSKFKYIADDLDRMVKRTERLMHDKF